MGPSGLEPETYGLTYHHDFRRPFGLQSRLCLHHAISGLDVSRQVVTPSLSGLARRWHFKAFTEFERFYIISFLISTPIKDRYSNQLSQRPSLFFSSLPHKNNFPHSHQSYHTTYQKHQPSQNLPENKVGCQRESYRPRSQYHRCEGSSSQVPFLFQQSTIPSSTCQVHELEKT